MSTFRPVSAARGSSEFGFLRRMAPSTHSTQATLEQRSPSASNTNRTPATPLSSRPNWKMVEQEQEQEQELGQEQEQEQVQELERVQE